MNRDELYDLIVDALEQAAFKDEWKYAGETALGSAVDVAEIIIAALEAQGDDGAE